MIEALVKKLMPQVVKLATESIEEDRRENLLDWIEDDLQDYQDRFESEIEDILDLLSKEVYESIDFKRVAKKLYDSRPRITWGSGQK